MKIKLKSIHEQVLVITGASSGIGRATALAAAKQGAKLVLCSRNQQTLQEVETEINASGGQAIAEVADVASREDLQHVADRAISHFGGFDTWVNNAGIGIFGYLDEVSEEDNRQLFETNFWGVVNGSFVALEFLKGRGGALINMGSLASDVPMPLQGMYSASKHAVSGFTDALRMEMEVKKEPISVTTIKPAGINTAFPHHAKNYMDKMAKLPPPVYEPQEVAYAIIHAATHPEREIYVGSGSKVMSTLNKYSPSLVDRINEKFMIPQQLREEPAGSPEHALYKAGQHGEVRGDQPGYVMKKSFYTRAVLNPKMASSLAAAAGLLAFAYFKIK